MGPSKAPRAECMAFEKLDGSNVRVKWTRNKGFALFGSRYALIDHTDPILGEVVAIFRKKYDEALNRLIRRQWPNEREVVVFGEFFGSHSFAGVHQQDDLKDYVIFDILVGHKVKRLVRPQDFVKLMNGLHIPRLIYRGMFGQEFVQRVRSNEFGLNEGVICKGTIDGPRGRWMCKVKTEEYFERLKSRGLDLKEYGEGE